MKKKKNWQRVIEKSSAQQFEKWFKNYELVLCGSYPAIMFRYFNTYHKNIKHVQEKLDIVLRFLLHEKRKEKVNILSFACFDVHDFIVENLLKRGWSPQESQRDCFSRSPIRQAFFPNFSEYIYEEKTKKILKLKQKRILSLLVQKGVLFHFDKIDEDFGKTTIQLIEKYKFQYIYSVLHELQENFNEEQRDEWRKIRLQQVVR